MNAIQRLRRLASTSIALATAGWLTCSWRRHARQTAPHTLPGRLCVSLTSYPPRYPTLALTLKSLLAQAVRPDVLYLWIAEADLAGLPPAVRELEADGVVIRSCADIRSYKKIIPLLALDAGAFIVIADDDVYYKRHWLQEIVAGYRTGQREVICTRAHRIRLDGQGRPLPYLQWESEVPAGEASPLLFPTGIGGVLYAPGVFHRDVTRTDLFQDLCPSTDDIWLYWMAALNGAQFRKVGRQTRPITWVKSQHVALATSNAARGTGNDEQIAKLATRYGYPPNWTVHKAPGPV